MAKICYVPWTPKGDTLQRIKDVNEVVAYYKRHELVLTLRQLYYRLVGLGKIPENTFRAYKNLQRIVNDGRLGGLIDWDAIEDRGRHLETRSTWASPQSILRGATNSYALPLWDEQDYHVEVWVEKDALLGVLEKVHATWRMNYTSTRGNTSQSEAYIAAERFRAMHKKGKKCVIIHLADHDPTGVDMTRDLEDRMIVFRTPVVVDRITLTFEQIQERNPPPQFAKESDSRFASYQAEFGDECWELDAIDPVEMIDIIGDAVSGYIDDSRWEDALSRELVDINNLSNITRNYDRVVRFLDEDKEEE